MNWEQDVETEALESGRTGAFANFWSFEFLWSGIAYYRAVDLDAFGPLWSWNARAPRRLDQTSKDVSLSVLPRPADSGWADWMSLIMTGKLTNRWPISGWRLKIRISAWDVRLPAQGTSETRYDKCLLPQRWADCKHWILLRRGQVGHLSPRKLSAHCTRHRSGCMMCCKTLRLSKWRELCQLMDHANNQQWINYWN